MGKTILSQQDEYEIIKLYQEDCSLKVIGDRYRIKPETVKKILINNSIPLRITGDFFKRCTEQDVLDIVKKYKSKVTLIELAKEYHTKQERIRDILIENGVEIYKGYETCQEKYSQEVRDEMVRLYESGLSYNDVAKQFGICSGQHVKLIISKENYEDRGMRKYKFDETFFEKIDSPIKAQVLGFIAADGYCNGRGLRIELKESDRDYLEAMNVILKNECPIRRYVREHNSPGFENASPSCALAINSGKLGQDLINLGIIPNKSLVMTYPDYISGELHPYYIRGYFEGDGCVCRNPSGSFGLKILGTREFLERVAEIITEQIGVDDFKLKKPSKIHALEVRSQPSMFEVMKWMYQDPIDFVMERKYSYLALMEERQTRLAGRWRRKKGAA